MAVELLSMSRKQVQHLPQPCPKHLPQPCPQPWMAYLIQILLRRVISPLLHRLLDLGLGQILSLILHLDLCLHLLLQASRASCQINQLILCLTNNICRFTNMNQPDYPPPILKGVLPNRCYQRIIQLIQVLPMFQICHTMSLVQQKQFQVLQ